MTEAAEKCPRCGEAHALIACNWVKAVVFDNLQPGGLGRVEFLTPADFPREAQQGEPDAYPKMTPRSP